MCPVLRTSFRSWRGEFFDKRTKLLKSFLECHNSQDKRVFVYKLMTVGTVEEKIVALQARKRELVEGLLNEERR